MLQFGLSMVCMHSLVVSWSAFSAEAQFLAKSEPPEHQNISVSRNEMVNASLATCVDLEALFQDGVEGERIWSAWKECYRHGYLGDAQDDKHLVAFNTNLAWVRKRNEELKAANESLRFGLNTFSYMSLAEFKETTSMKDRPPFNASADVLQEDAPWKGRPAGTHWDGTNCILPHAPVKDQGRCGTCWLFASVGAAEQSLVLHLHNKYQRGPESLSTQYLIDCKSAVRKHCDGGWTNDGTGWLSDLGRAPSQANYAHKYSCDDKDQNSCKQPNSCDVGDTTYHLGSRIAARFEQGGWPYKTWKHMMGGDKCDSFQSYGYAVSMCAGSSGWQNYKQGVLTDCSCSACKNDYLSNNHAMLIVGWGVHEGTKYWYIRNSWGIGWGLAGYIMIQREKGGVGCACMNEISAQFLGIQD